MNEFRARAVWLVLVVAMMTLLVGVVAVSSTVIGELPRQIRRWWWRRTFLFGVLSGLAAMVISRYDESQAQTLVWSMYSQIALPRCDLRTFYHVVNGFVAVPIVFAVSALSSTVPLCEWEKLPPERLASQIHGAQAVLYMTGLALVVCVIQMGSIFNWIEAWNLAAGHTVQTDAANNVIRYGRAAGTAVGVLVSLFLVATYGPVAFVHRSRARLLVLRAKPEGSASERQQWLKDRGLAIDYKAEIASIVAVLAPFTAGGPLGALVVHWLQASSK